MLSHKIHGGGPPLLLIHGFGISFNIWNGLRPILADHFTCIEAELPGIGLSPAPPRDSSYLAAAVDALESLRASLSIARWRVLSYSTGTRVAEAYLHAHAERVERAVFLCPAQATSANARGLRFADKVDARFPPVGNWILSGWRIRFLIQLLGFNLKTNALAPAWFAEITSQPVHILKTTLRSMPGGGVAPIHVPPKIPALFVWGKEDLITVRPKRSSSRDVIIHANHSMPQTGAKEAAEIVAPFLRG
ncbi:MAG: 2-succinyl-6-hydroxy-2,4-cyclohexadiene-1-carboxylate synthase [Anaerolineales bacterium]|nr:2-succinyl-6-hydroxy-2,4-cyclohexadiene-1-carboxylate synthase [Anaerolineales bacterium]